MELVKKQDEEQLIKKKKKKEREPEDMFRDDHVNINLILKKKSNSTLLKH